MKKFLLGMICMVFAISVSAKPYLINTITIERNGSEELITFIYSDEWEEEEMTLVGGKLMKVTDGYSEFTLDYANLSSNILTMTRVDKDGDTTLYEMTLNEEGNVVKVLEYKNGVLDEDYCTFEYTEGRLTNYKQINSEDIEESVISYDEWGRLSKVEVTDNYNETDKDVISYAYQKSVDYTQVGYLWDTFYGVDLDDMEWVAVAGYLGDRINGIPTNITTTSKEGVESKHQDWDTDGYGYPIWITVSEDNESERYIINWYSGPTINVETISAEKAESARFFSGDGVEVSGDAKGLVIERKGDGSTVKRLNR